MIILRRLLFFVLLIFSVTSFSYGLMNVETYPSGARVIVDDIETGYSPVSFELSSGFHRVAIVLDGFETFERFLKIEDAEVLNIKKLLRLVSVDSESTGVFFYELAINDFEPADWLKEKTAVVLDGAMDEVGFKLSEIDATRKLSVEINGVGENTFSMTATSSSIGFPFLPSFRWEKTFVIKGLRENYENIFTDIAYELAGEIGSYYQQTNRARQGDIEIVGVDVSAYPELKIIFSPIDTGDNYIDMEKLLNSKFRIIEGDNNLEPFDLPLKYSGAGINIVIDIENDLKETPEEIKDIIKSFMDKLPGESEIALVSTMSELKPIKNFTDDTGEIINSMKFIENQPYYSLEESLVNSFDLLSSRKGANFLLIISDTDNSKTIRKDLLENVKNEGLVILAIGIGERNEFGLLENLAGISGGAFVNIKNHERFAEALEEMLGRIDDLYEISYETAGMPGGIFRIQTADGVFESEFVIEKSIMDVGISVPDNIVTGIPFEIELSSLATATYPLELEILLEDASGNQIINSREDFTGSRNLEVLVKNPGEHKLKIEAPGFAYSVAFKAMPISEAMDFEIKAGDYLAARELALVYMSTGDYLSNEEYNLVLKKLIDVDFEIAILKGSFVPLREIVDLTGKGLGVDGDNKVSGALALAYLGELDESQELLDSLKVDDYDSQNIKALQIIYSLAGDKEELALEMTRENIDKIESPHLLRACADTLLRSGHDEEAIEAARISRSNITLLDYANIFMIGLMTLDSNLIEEAQEAARLIPGADEFSLGFDIYKEWFFGDLNKARELLNTGLIEYVDSPLLTKMEGYIEAYENDYVASKKTFEKAFVMDTEDRMLYNALEENSFGSNVYIETPGETKIINGSENTLIRLRGESAHMVMAEVETRKIPFYRDILSPYFRGVYGQILDRSENLDIVLKDSNGDVVDATSITVIYDEQPPAIYTDSLVYTNSDTPYIAATFKDDVGLSSGFIGDEKFDFSGKDIEKGIYVKVNGRSEELVIGAVDLSGRRTQKKIEIVYDQEKPFVEIFGKSLFREAESEYRIVVEDDLNLKSIRLNGKDYPVYNQNHVENTFVLTLEPDETRLISAIAVDSAGNVRENYLRIKRDYAPPAFYIDSKVHGDVLLVMVVAADEAGVNNVKFGEAMREFQNPKGIRTEFEVPFKSEISVGVGDSLGNYSERLFGFRPDTEEPEIKYDLDPDDYDTILVDYYDKNDLKFVRAGNKLVKVDYESDHRIELQFFEEGKEIELIGIDASDNSSTKKLRRLPVKLIKDYKGYLSSRHIVLEAETDEPVEYTIAVNERIYKGKTETGLIDHQITLDPGKNTVKLLVRGEYSIGGKIFDIEYSPEKSPLSIKLEWPESAGDLGLYVMEPTGKTLYYDSGKGSNGIERYSKKFEGSAVLTEEYTLKGLPETGEYSFRVHCSEILDKDELKFSVIANNFGEIFTSQEIFTTANPDNSLPGGTGKDWFGGDRVFYGVGDQEKPGINSDIQGVLLTSSDTASVTFNIKDNMGISEVVTGIEFASDSEKHYDVFGEDKYTINELRSFPDGISTLYIKAKDIYGLESTERLTVLTDTVPPEILKITLEKDERKANLYIRIADNLGIGGISINGIDYFTGGLEKIEKNYELIEEIELPQNVENIEIKINDLVGNETVKTIGW